MSQEKKVAFISGHIDLTQEQFSTHYVSKIDKAIEENHEFVLGNSFGCDEMALRYLKSKNVSPDKITIHHRESRCDQFNKQHLTIADLRAMGYNKIISGFTTFDERDESMTLVSDYDIAWVRPDMQTKELMESLGKKYSPTRKSGTLKNILRRSASICQQLSIDKSSK